MDEKVFADGMIFQKPNEHAPDFVKGHIAIKVEEAVAMLEKNKKKDGWVNIDLKKSKGGKLYLEVNTWTPPEKELKDTSVSF